MEKIQQLMAAGIKIDERLPLIIEPSEYSRAYLETKAARSGHLLGDLSETTDVERIKAMADEMSKDSS